MKVWCPACGKYRKFYSIKGTLNLQVCCDSCHYLIFEAKKKVSEKWSIIKNEKEKEKENND